MKTETDVVEHVAATTGIAEPQVRRIVEAAFAFVRERALAGEGVSHPSLGAIRVRVREKPGAAPRTVYRFDPEPGAKGGGKGGKRGRGRRRGAAGGPGEA